MNFLKNRLFNSVTQKVWGVFSILRNLFTKKARAEEQYLNDRQKSILIEREKLEKNDKGPRYLLDLLNKEQKDLDADKNDFYQVINAIRALPPGGSRFFYFEALIKILSLAGRAEEILDVGKIYTFKYVAKTPGKWYDLHPVSLILDRNKGLIQGINYHWENQPQYNESPFRTYNPGRRATFGYRIEPHELEEVLKLDTFYPIFIPNIKSKK